MKRIEALSALWKRWRYAALIAAAGAALLLLPGGGEPAAAAAEAPAENVEEAAREMEKRMETILRTIDGAGELHLMLTADTGAERHLARDTDISCTGSAVSPEDYQRKEETVLIGGSSGGPVVTQTRCPTWRGALVVCQGGGNAQVRLAVTAAVSALTGLGADRITVAKCQ